MLLQWVSEEEDWSGMWFISEPHCCSKHWKVEGSGSNRLFTVCQGWEDNLDKVVLNNTDRMGKGGIISLRICMQIMWELLQILLFSLKSAQMQVELWRSQSIWSWRKGSATSLEIHKFSGQILRCLVMCYPDGVYTCTCSTKLLSSICA